MRFNSTEQTISWFRDRYRDGSLKIKPPYQRKPVWTAKQKSYLIESILLQLPVPEIYIQQSVSEEGDTTFAVVDGQQRIRTVLQFIGSELDPEEAESNKFLLESLPTSSRWRNASFAGLSPEEKRAFYGYRFVVRVLETDDDAQVRDMFMRLNRFLTALNAQELRNATYSGPFVDLVLELADEEYWTENSLFTAALIRRMRDVEYISELLIGTLHGPQGGNAAIIDSYYEQYEDYEDEFPDQRRAEHLFRQTLKTVELLIPEIRYLRWKNRADFYSLFVCLASLLRSQELPEANVSQLANTLYDFAAKVDSARSDETPAEKDIEDYLDAVQRGVNEKARRARRHGVLRQIMEPYFEPRLTRARA
jgi:hypothetical protein